MNYVSDDIAGQYTARMSCDLHQSLYEQDHSVVTPGRCAILLLLAMLLHDTAQLHAAENVDPDRVFLRQLAERRLHDLAAQHCLMQLERSTHDADRVTWQLLLCEVYEHQVWFTDSETRSVLITQAIDDVNQAFNSLKISAEQAFELRLHQVRLVRTDAQAALLLASAGRLSDLPSDAAHLTSTGETTSSDSVRLKQQIQKGITIIDDLLSQLDRVREQLPRQVVRELRGEFRLLTGELHLLRHRLFPQDNTAGGHTPNKTATMLLTQAMRTSQDSSIKYRARWLLGEMMVSSAGDAEFDAWVKSLNSAADPSYEYAPELLMVYRLLRQQKAETAIERLRKMKGRTLRQQQRLHWLLLESHLCLRKLADQLRDQDMTTQAQMQFQIAARQARQQCSGVYRDAVEITAEEFRLIDSVGIKAARAIQQVRRHRDSGNANAAIRAIDVSLEKLAANGDEDSRGTLQLLAGEIYVDEQQWELAMVRLESAVRSFSTSQNTERQAVADLLRIFVLAQKLRSAPHDASTSKYIAAIESHLEQFRGQVTADTARQWLAQILEGSDPVRAASILREMLDKDQSDTDKLATLTQLARTIERLPASNNTLELVSRFQANVAELPNEESASDIRLTVLELYSLDFRTRFNTAIDPASGRNQLAVIKKQLAFHAESNNGAIGEAAMKRSRLLDALLLAQQSDRGDDFRNAAEQLLNDRGANHAEALDYFVKYLTRVSDRQTRRPETNRVAFLIAGLLRKRLEAQSSTSKPETQMQWLTAAQLVAAVTGDSETQSEVLKLLTQQKLNERQLAQIAEVLALPTSIPRPANELTKSYSSVRTRFWRRIVADYPQGSQSWLEASLQLAAVLKDAGHTQASRQQLSVVSVLYPAWGSASRLERVRQLERQLGP